MTSNHSEPTSVATALRAGLTNAQLEGTSSVAAAHLEPELLETLIAATLDHLRSRPGKPSPIAGWSLVTARQAAVLSWWAEVGALTESERRQLGPLRWEVYDLLVERNLIETGPGRSASVHVSPAESEVAESEVAESEVAESEVAESSHAWILKLSPYVYDASRVFGSPDGRVRVWSLEDGERSASMQSGDRVYLWVGEGDPYRAPGVWGVGYVAGPAVPGLADDGWLDIEAASRVTGFALVDLVLIDVPVTRQAFLNDPRLVGAEVICDPFAVNPGRLSASEAAALAEYLPPVAALEEAQVA